MAGKSVFGDADDPYNLSRFVQAQQDDYTQALAEIRSGQKRSHWMWYVFPQFDGLGHSSMSRRYSIKKGTGGGGVPEASYPRAAALRVLPGGPQRGGAIRARDIRFSRRHETEVVCHPVRARVPCRLGVPSAARQIFPGWA